MRNTTVTSAPTPTDLIDLNLFKKSAKVTHTYDDAYYVDIINTAYYDIEEMLQKAILTQTRKLTMDSFGNEDKVLLDWPPLASVSSVDYYPDTWTSGSATTFSSSNYLVITDTFAGYVQLKDGQSWPAGLYPREDCVQITYVCGAAAASVDAAIKQAIRFRASELYKDEDHSQKIEKLVSPYRRYSFA